MANEIIPYQPRPLAPRDRRALAEVREVRRPARCAMVNLDAAAIVAEAGLQNIERLTAAEVAVCRRQGALIDARAREVVDTYTLVVRRQLLGLAWGGE